MPLGKMSKEDSRELSRWLETVNLKNLRWGPKKKKKSAAPKPRKVRPGPNASIETLAVLPISKVDVGDQLLAPDRAAIAELKASIALGGDVAPPIVVRKRSNGVYELLDGYTRLAALREIGSPTISAIVWSNLSDWDARFRRNAGQRGRVRTALDRALIDDELFELMKEKVAQDATPRGGRQPDEQYIRKVAKQLNISKDRLARSRQIAGIAVEVRQKLRDLGLDGNQALLLKIARAGDAAKQMEALDLDRSSTEAGSKSGPQRKRTPRAGEAKNVLSDGGDHSERIDARKPLQPSQRHLSDRKDREGGTPERDFTNDKERKVIVQMKNSDFDQIEQHPAGTRFTLSTISVRQKSCSLMVRRIEKLSVGADAPA